MPDNVSDTPFNDPENKNIWPRLDVTCPCVLYHNDVLSPIDSGTPGGKLYIHTDSRRYVFSNVPSIVSSLMPKTCSLHNHIYVPVRRAFVDVGLSPISVRTIYRNLHACICESESFCVQSCAFLIRWRSGKNIHNFHSGIAFLRVHTYVWLD